MCELALGGGRAIRWNVHAQSCDEHDPLRHALDARDLKHADECSLHAREVRLGCLALAGSVSPLRVWRSHPP